MEKIPDPLVDTEAYAAQNRRVTRQTALLSLVIALSCGLAFIAFGLDSPILPVVLLVCIAVPVLIWHDVRVALYILYTATCLIEMRETHFPDAITDRIPFFWNINTIVQVYAHADFKAIPFNTAELLLVLAGTTSLVRAVAMNNVSVRLGPLFTPIAVYIGFVCMGWVNGMATGGDFKESLQEVRSQIYFLITYLMAFNLVKERKHVHNLLWITVICIAIKGALYTYRRYVTIAGMELPDQGVGSHEEAFLFDTFIALMLTLGMCNVQKRMQTVMWFLMPLVVTGNLATNRRAATAAMIVLIPILLMAAYRAMPHRRKVIAIIGVALLAGGMVYYQAFKNSPSMFAQPARAVKSEFEPSARDASSNAYRDAENACLMATIRVAPVQGYGYGKRMLHAVPIADISHNYEWWDLLPHNQILWVWMRIGTVGFFVFWYMICAILIFFCEAIQSQTTDAETKAVCIFTVATVAMLMIFGLLDLQISSARDMIFAGLWIGAAAAMLKIESSPSAKGGGESKTTLSPKVGKGGSR